MSSQLTRFSSELVTARHNYSSAITWSPDCVTFDLGSPHRQRANASKCLLKLVSLCVCLPLPKHNESALSHAPSYRFICATPVPAPSSPAIYRHAALSLAPFRVFVERDSHLNHADNMLVNLKKKISRNQPGRAGRRVTGTNIETWRLDLVPPPC